MCHLGSWGEWKSVRSSGRKTQNMISSFQVILHVVIFKQRFYVHNDKHIQIFDG